MKTTQMNTTTPHTNSSAANNHHDNNAESLRLKQEITMLEERIATLSNELHRVYGSRSWKITRPLRLLVYFGHAVKRGSQVKNFSKKLAYATIAFLENKPRLKFFLIGSIKKMGLRDYFLGLSQIPTNSNNNVVNSVNAVDEVDDFLYRPKNIQALSHEGLGIYKKITNNISKSHMSDLLHANCN
jgi:hypothetical protein